MLSIRRKISIAIIFLAIIFSSFFYLYSKIYLSIGSATEKVTIPVVKGDNALDVGEKLSKKGVIDGKYYLAFYLWRKNQLHSIVAGVYDFAPGIKIPEVAKIITGGEIASTRIPVTFPEGWTIADMAKRLDANGFSGNDFLAIANDPSQELRDKYDFLGELPKGQSLEGYLFPDTYYFAKDATADDIIGKMLGNFSQKVTAQMRSDAIAQKKTLYQVITMASIVEGEVRSDEDRATVAGVFWNRINNGQRLESDATLEYVLQTKALQHSTQETQNTSPYNTYRTAGLPPGPVSNPGLSSIVAALHPADTQFNYFLTDPKTGKTVFSKTYAEHLANKAKYGL